MKPNPFTMPGSGLIKPPNSTPSPSKDIFIKTPLGGGGGKPKKAPAPEPEPEPEPFIPETKPQPAAAPKARLTNPQWGETQKGSGEFNQKITVQADADLDPEVAHLTRVEFQLIALTPDGKRENIDKQSGHIQDGTASAEATLFYPQYRKNGELLDTCDFVFTAKHRDSKELESKPLKVTGPVVPIGKILVQFLTYRGKPLADRDCALRGEGKSFPAQRTDAEGKAEWAEIPLGDYSVEIAFGSAKLLKPVPWLMPDADLHIQRIRPPKDSGLED